MSKGVVSARKRLLSVAGFLAAFSILLAATNFALYRRARTHLDAQLGERLRVIAVALCHAVEPADSAAPFELGDEAYAALVRARREYDLSNVVVVTPDGRTVADLAGLSSPGDFNPYLELDVDAVDLARAGLPSYTSLYRTGDFYMKSAYAPVLSPRGDVVGILGVEAGAGFFAQLRELANLIVMISIGNATVVAVLGLLFYRQSRSLDRAQAAMLERENLAALGRMVATIAHEIRNPLSIIRASAERIQRKHAIDDEALSYITGEVDELDRVLTGYLEFAHARPGAFVPVSLAQSVRRALSAVEDERAAKRVQVVERLPETDVVIAGDEKRIRQAVLNVLLNAVQAAPEGGRVEVSLAANDTGARVVVADNGPGIEPAHAADVAKPFFTTKTHGSGLGLSVVRAVMEAHGGSLAIENDAGGARVTLVFPTAPTPSGATEGTAEA
ncbi:MAG: ATP-binding protein [Candidatus Latescibacteria bacterium]|nr:ATP-binding protein [Candidatus Latescibacterota bacterium]